MTCPSTTPLADNEATDTLIAAGLATTVDEATALYRGWHGRRMCANPGCHGAVLRTKTGLRKHIIGSNLTDAERVALTGVTQ
jgi:hypothetical protein